MPLIPRMGPGDVIPLRKVAPQDVGSGAGDLAYSDAAGTIAQASAQIQAAEQAGNVARGVAAASAALDSRRLEEEQNPDHNGREQRFETYRRQVVKQFRDEIKGRSFQEDYDLRMFSMGERQKLAVRQGVTARRLDIAKGDSLRAMDALVQQAVTAESDVLRQGYLDQAQKIADAAEATGALSAVEKSQLLIAKNHAIQDADSRRTSQRVADEIFAGTSDPQARLAKARKQLGDGDPALLDRTIARVRDMNNEERYAKALLDRTIARVRDMNNEERYAKAQHDKEQADAYTKRLYDGTLKHEDLVGADLPANLRAGLEAGLEHQDYIAAHRSVNGAQLPERGEIKTDQAVKARLASLFADPSRRVEASREDMNTHRSELSKADYDKLEHDQFAPDPDAEMIERHVKSYVEEYFAPEYNPATPDERHREFVFRASVAAALDRKRIELKRRSLLDEEIEAVLRGQIQSYTRKEWFSDPHIRGFELGITQADRDLLRDELIANGISSPTDQEIQRVWLDKQNLTLEETP